MYVREYMNPNVITVTSDTLVHDAQKLMKDHGIRRLPVVDKGKLVGLVTQDRLRDVAPSPATSLSIWELNYLLAKMKVKDVMVKNVITIGLDATLEEAARLGQERQIGTLPVVKDGMLVGIITATDLFKVLTQVMRFGQPGARIHIHHCAKGEPVNRVIEILIRHKVGITALFGVTPPGHGEEDTIIHVDTPDVGPIMAELGSLGCQIEVRPH